MADTNKCKYSKMLLAFEYLDSTTSSEDEVEEIIKKRRRLNKPKIKNFVDDVVNKYNENEFKENFRLHETTANLIIQMFKTSRHSKSNFGGKEQISAKTQILTFLWFAGNKSSLREVECIFNLSISAAHSIITNVMEFLEKLAPNVIKFPETTEDLKKTAEEFKEIAGFPNVVGCVDGSYINIRTPKHKIKSTYTNRHDITSLALQGICDSKKRFLDIFTGVSGKIHDSRIYHLSFVSKKLPKILKDTYHIIGDAAYPLSVNLLIPYRNYGILTQKQRNYNYKFCATRVVIENAFGLLKNRFRQLMLLEFHTVERSATFIRACCVLHNLCIENNDIMDIEIGNKLDTCSEETDSVEIRQLNSVNKIKGEQKRSKISEML